MRVSPYLEPSQNDPAILSVVMRVPAQNKRGKDPKEVKVSTVSFHALEFHVWSEFACVGLVTHEADTHTNNRIPLKPVLSEHQESKLRPGSGQI